jgi:hypothetical protein
MPTRDQQDFSTWLRVAESINLGDYRNADDDTRKSLCIGLRGYGSNETVTEALEKLERLDKKKKK